MNNNDQINKPATKSKRSTWWKIYFFVMTFLSVIGMTSLLSDPAAGIAEYAMLALSIVSSVGLFAFVFNKPILNPEFWRYTLFSAIALNVLYYFMTNVDLRMDMTDSMFYLSQAFGWLISLPAFYGLYALSRSDNPLWQEA